MGTHLLLGGSLGSVAVDGSNLARQMLLFARMRRLVEVAVAALVRLLGTQP